LGGRGGGENAGNRKNPHPRNQLKGPKTRLKGERKPWGVSEQTVITLDHSKSVRGGEWDRKKTARNSGRGSRKTEGGIQKEKGNEENLA